ncbi:unnamed protein product [Arabis nemorensis]|uniref:Uncharacterized protein n=1 Tax=Arabis nemorensis TaxID=586526 RepID=A0A565B1E3_9BRAS|nr:unnamed protein product [Arabis nemorensis]
MGSVLFGGRPEVPAFTAAIEQHQKRNTDTILDHARQICADKSVDVKIQVIVGDPKYKICEDAENLHQLKAGEPLYVLLCCWVAAVGARLLKSKEILEGVTKISLENYAIDIGLQS